MRKVSEKQQRKVAGGFGWYAYCNCPCLSANVCKKKYKDSNGSKGKFKHKYYFWFQANSAWYSAYLSAIACEAVDCDI